MKIISFLLLLVCFNCLSQTPSYWINFTDKNNSSYSISTPNFYLSQRSIDRRAKSGITISIEDLPVNSTYVDSVLASGNIQFLQSSKWFNAIAIQTTDTNALIQIQTYSFVLGIEKVKGLKQIGSESKFEKITKTNENINIYTIPNYPYGLSYKQLSLHGADKLQDLGFRGQNMHIAVIDAGFFKANELDGLSDLFTEGRILSTYDFVDREETVYEDHQHGSMVLSVIGGSIDGIYKGTAPKASFHLLRTEDASSETLLEEYNWIAAAEYADSVGVDIINTSLGYTTFDDSTQNHTYQDFDGNTTIIAKAADIASSKGILVCVSAGNSGASAWQYISTPADADSILTIAAVDSNGTRAFFSSVGPASDGDIKPNVASVGWFTYLISPSTGEVIQGNGTSFSSPMIAGMAACLWQALPNKTNIELKQLIEESSSQFNNPDSLLGYGVPNIFNAYSTEVGLTYSTPANNLIEELFPNPVVDRVNVIYISKNEQDVIIRIFNEIGTILLSDSQNVSIGKNKIVIENLDSFSSGNYYIEIHDSEGEKSVIKFVII